MKAKPKGKNRDKGPAVIGGEKRKEIIRLLKAGVSDGDVVEQTGYSMCLVGQLRRGLGMYKPGMTIAHKTVCPGCAAELVKQDREPLPPLSTTTHPEWVRPCVAAKAFGVKVSEVKTWIKLGLIDVAHTPGGQVRIPRSALPQGPKPPSTEQVAALIQRVEELIAAVKPKTEGGNDVVVF